MGWQPIKSVPKDGTEIDLWLVDQDGDAARATSCYWAKGVAERTYEYAADGSHKVVWRKRDGWFDDRAGWEGEGAFVDWPRNFNLHPKQNREMFTEATHWMPVPSPPNQGE